MGSPMGATFCNVTRVVGHQPHIQQAAAQRALAAHGGDDGALAQGQIVDGHKCLPKVSLN